MKSLRILVGAVALCGILGASSLVAAEPQGQADKKEKLKPYTLKTCPVTGEKLGDMGDPYVHKYQNREIKFCCKSCLKDFNKEPAKYVKKIEEQEKAAAKQEKKDAAKDHSGH